MSSRVYPRLDIETFGAHLLRSGDVDPVYVALRALDLPRGKLQRWLLAYWMFYDAGAASWLAEREGADWWEQVTRAAFNADAAPTGGRWPRGKERRHFRGPKCIAAVASLRRTYEERPEDLVGLLTAGNRPLRFEHLRQQVMDWPMFGPWIAFKAGDMVERCLGVPVDFTAAEVFMFDDPREAAIMLWRAKQGLPDTAHPRDEEDAIRRVVAYLQDQFATYTAPGGGRAVGLQEIETVLCKWKSHQRGHYPPNNDITEVGASVVLWAPHSALARRFAHALPEPLETQ